MRRYLRLYKVLIQSAIKSRLEYKADTVIGILSFFISNIVLKIIDFRKIMYICEPFLEKIRRFIY